MARRVARMFADGLVAETRDLLDRGLRDGRTASRALGYAAGRGRARRRAPRGDAGAARETVRATRRFVRRQRSWFRRDRRIVWLDAAAPGPLDGARLRRCVTCVRRDTPGIPFSKGHGTENDFVVLPDPDGVLDLTDARVAALCDRRAGLGARRGAAGGPRGPRSRTTRSPPSRASSGSWTTATRTAASRRCAATACGSTPTGSTAPAG